MEFFSLPNILFFSAMALLIIVSGGVLYLTAVEWRNRRLRDQERGGRAAATPTVTRQETTKKKAKK